MSLFWRNKRGWGWGTISGELFPWVDEGSEGSLYITSRDWAKNDSTASFSFLRVLCSLLCGNNENRSSRLFFFPAFRLQNRTSPAPAWEENFKPAHAVIVGTDRFVLWNNPTPFSLRRAKQGQLWRCRRPVGIAVSSAMSLAGLCPDILISWSHYNSGIPVYPPVD